MEWDWVINLLKLFIKVYMVLFILNFSAYGQITERFEEVELTTESVEINEELRAKLNMKISFDEFISDYTIYSLFLTNIQHQEILKHIVNTGNLIDLLELQSIGIINYDDYTELKKILLINHEEQLLSKNKININIRNSFQSKIEDNYVGGHWGNYQQFKYSNRHYLGIGLAREVDIGESIDLLYADHYSYYLTKKWKNNTLTFGAFQVYHGFGMLIGQGYSTSFGNGGISNYLQHRWAPIANMTEVNYMKGICFNKIIKNSVINIGYSNQKIDTGIQSGYHRTPNEIKKKDKLNEELILIGVDNNLRLLRSQILLIFDSEFNIKGISVGSRYFYRNTILFGESSYSFHKLAFTSGILVMLTKDIPFSIAYTSFEKEYKTPWQGYSIQGFSANDGNGIGVNLKIPLKKKWTIDFTYRFSKKIENSEDYEQKSKFYKSVRIDKILNKNIHINTLTILQRSNFEKYSSRSRISLKIIHNELFTQSYQLYINQINDNISNALSYSFQWKHMKIQGVYSIAFLKIQSKNPIYYSVDNILQSRQSVGVFNSGSIQSLGFQYKILKGLRAGFFIQKNYDADNNAKSVKATFNLKYQ